jgi:hypothetical protein
MTAGGGQAGKVRLPDVDFRAAEVAPHRRGDNGEVVQLAELLQPRHMHDVAKIGAGAIAVDKDSLDRRQTRRNPQARTAGAGGVVVDLRDGGRPETQQDHESGGRVEPPLRTHGGMRNHGDFSENGRNSW